MKTELSASDILYVTSTTAGPGWVGGTPMYVRGPQLRRIAQVVAYHGKLVLTDTPTCVRYGDIMADLARPLFVVDAAPQRYCSLCGQPILGGETIAQVKYPDADMGHVRCGATGPACIAMPSGDADVFSLSGSPN